MRQCGQGRLPAWLLRELRVKIPGIYGYLVGDRGTRRRLASVCFPLSQVLGPWTRLRAALAVIRPSASLSLPVWLGGRWRLMKYRNLAHMLGGPAGGRPLSMDGTADVAWRQRTGAPHCDCASDPSWQRYLLAATGTARRSPTQRAIAGHGAGPVSAANISVELTTWLAGCWNGVGPSSSVAGQWLESSEREQVLLSSGCPGLPGIEVFVRLPLECKRRPP